MRDFCYYFFLLFFCLFLFFFYFILYFFPVLYFSLDFYNDNFSFNFLISSTSICVTSVINFSFSSSVSFKYVFRKLGIRQSFRRCLSCTYAERENRHILSLLPKNP